MTDIKEIKINVPVPVSKTRKGKRVPKPDTKQVNASPLNTKPAALNTKPVQKLVGGEPMPVLSTIRMGGSKKPVLKVPLPYSNSPHTPSPAPVKVVQKQIVRKSPQPVKVLVQPTKRKNFTMKRKFTEKRITIQVENSNKLKKNRESIEKKVKNMPLSEITEKLRARGLVRPVSNPPEAMQRTMMTDILMFPNPL